MALFDQYEEALKTKNYNAFFEALANANAEVNDINPEGENLLHKAVVDLGMKRCDRSVLERLLQHPMIKVNEPCQFGRPLHYAIIDGALESLKLLLQHPDIEVNHPDEVSGKTPLEWCFPEDLKAMEALLSHPKIDLNSFRFPNQKNPENGRTLLHVACAEGRILIVQRLLEDTRFHVNLLDNEECSPLWMAVTNKRSEIVKCLLSHPNINVHLHGSGGIELLFAAVQNLDMATFDALAASLKIDINGKNRENETLAELICRTGEVAIIEKLLSHPLLNAKAALATIGDLWLFPLSQDETHAIEVATWKTHPSAVPKEVKTTLTPPREFIADCDALVEFLKEGLLKKKAEPKHLKECKEKPYYDWSPEANSIPNDVRNFSPEEVGALRYFSIMEQLAGIKADEVKGEDSNSPAKHRDLYTMILNRTFGSSSDFIPLEEKKRSFRDLVRNIEADAYRGR